MTTGNGTQTSILDSLETPSRRRFHVGRPNWRSIIKLRLDQDFVRKEQSLCVLAPRRTGESLDDLMPLRGPLGRSLHMGSEGEQGVEGHT